MNETLIERSLLVIIILVLLYIVLKYKITQFNSKRKNKKRFKRGLELENEARFYLQNLGYSIISEQEIHYHKYAVNNQNVESKLILDYVVKKNGKRYIVEVKSGKSAISLKDKNSRRQLLEYDFVIENDGIFLLDMENRNMQLVKFYSKAEIGEHNLRNTIIVLAVLGILIPFWKIKLLLLIILLIILKFPVKSNKFIKMIHSSIT